MPWPGRRARRPPPSRAFGRVIAVLVRFAARMAAERHHAQRRMAIDDRAGSLRENGVGKWREDHDRKISAARRPSRGAVVQRGASARVKMMMRFRAWNAILV